MKVRTNAILAIVLLISGSVYANTGHERFAHPEFLISVEELATALHHPKLVLIDARGVDDYAASHIPGAVSLPARSLDRTVVLSTGTEVRRMVKSADQIASDYSRAGIDEDSYVVIYDVGGSSLAARVWWTLDYYGHGDIAILDGGLTAWENADHAVTTRVPRGRTGGFDPVPNPAKIADFDYVKARLGSESTAVCNALSHESYTEAAIPASVSLPRTLTVGEESETPLLKEADTLDSLFSGVAADKNKEIIFYCGAGYAAAQDYFVARLLGYTNVRNYDGSLTEWRARGEQLLPSGGA